MRPQVDAAEEAYFKLHGALSREMEENAVGMTRYELQQCAKLVAMLGLRVKAGGAGGRGGGEFQSSTNHSWFRHEELHLTSGLLTCSTPGAHNIQLGLMLVDLGDADDTPGRHPTPRRSDSSTPERS